MAIGMSCPGCGAKLSFKDESARRADPSWVLACALLAVLASADLVAC